MTTVTITLGGTSYEARVPTSFADREDVARAFRDAGDNVRRSKHAFAAAVAACVPELAPAKSLDDCDGDALAYGTPAYEALRAKGATSAEIAAAGRACFALIVEGLYPRAPDVEAAETFSQAGAPPT